MIRQLTNKKQGNCKKIKYLFEINREKISSNNLNHELLFHYSIPNVQKFNNGCFENGNDIESDKLLINNKQLIISKLNPRKSTICIAHPQKNLTICSSEFICLVPNNAEISLEFAYYLFSMKETSQLLDSMVE